MSGQPRCRLTNPCRPRQDAGSAGWMIHDGNGVSPALPRRQGHAIDLTSARGLAPTADAAARTDCQVLRRNMFQVRQPREGSAESVDSNLYAVTPTTAWPGAADLLHQLSLCTDISADLIHRYLQRSMFCWRKAIVPWPYLACFRIIDNIYLRTITSGLRLTVCVSLGEFMAVAKWCVQLLFSLSYAQQMHFRLSLCSLLCWDLVAPHRLLSRWPCDLIQTRLFWLPQSLLRLFSVFPLSTPAPVLLRRSCYGRSDSVCWNRFATRKYLNVRSIGRRQCSWRWTIRSLPRSSGCSRCTSPSSIRRRNLRGPFLSISIEPRMA